MGQIQETNNENESLYQHNISLDKINYNISSVHMPSKNANRESNHSSMQNNEE